MFSLKSSNLSYNHFAISKLFTFTACSNAVKPVLYCGVLFLKTSKLSYNHFAMARLPNLNAYSNIFKL